MVVVRLLRGVDSYWAVGTQRVARLPLGCVVDDGLTAEASQALAGAGLSPPPETDLYHLTVVVTTRCNLACAYCFQNVDLPAPGQAGVPTRIRPAALDDRTLAATFAFTKRRMAERGATKLDLMLFGGEPTLQQRECVRILEGAHDLGLASATMTSNGTLFTVASVIALERAGLQNVQVTLDGDAEAHDRSRVTIGGRGTFNQIINNLAAASENTDLRWSLRVNLTRDSVGGADALVDRLTGRLDPSKFGLYFAVVHDAGIGFADTVEHSSGLADRVVALYLRAMAAGFAVSTPREGSCMACDAIGGTSGAVVNADGTLYSCWESAGKDGMAVGTVFDGYLPEDTLRPRWVACGYSAENQPPAARKVFQDTVDAALLDRMHATGRLNRRPASTVA